MRHSYKSVTGTYSFVVGGEQRKGSEEIPYARSAQTSFHTKILIQALNITHIMQRGQEAAHSRLFGANVRYKGSYISLPHMPSQCARGQAFIYK